MTEESAVPASAYPCPVCATSTTLEHPCPGCGRAPDPDAAAVIGLDVRIQELRRQVDEAKLRHDELVRQLADARRQREAHATAVRAAVAAETGATARTSAPGPTAAPQPARAPEQVGIAGRAEASTGTVQNLLFILGGLLLGIAAIVFTVVAWAKFGQTGRAAILTVVTLVTLAVPPLVLRRGLRATAETFAALGLLLLLLDGYAAWFVNLGGIKDSWDASFYAGTVCALTALAAFAYGRLFRLTGPDLMALAAAQPVLPLFFAESDAVAEVWALIYAALALGNIAVLRLKRAPMGFAVLASLLHAIALLLALLMSVLAWVGRGTILSSVALVAVAVVIAFGAWVGGAFAHRVVAGAAVAVALAAGLVRPVLPEVSASGRLAVAAAAGALVALLAWVLGRVAVPSPEPVPQPEPEPADERMPALWSTFDPAKEQAKAPAPLEAEPNPWAIGARIGAYVALGVPAVIALVWAAWLGAESVLGQPQAFAWERPLAIVLLTGGAVLLARGYMRDLLVVAGAVTLAMVLPGPSIADVAVAAALLVWAYFHDRTGFQELVGFTALGLGAHAIAVELGEPPVRTMFALTAVVVLGLAVAMVAPRRGYHPIGGVAAGVVDLALPWLAYFTVAAFGGGPVASWRVLVMTVLVVPLLGAARLYRGYHVVAGLVIAVYPLWPVLPGNESEAIYAGLAAMAAAMVVFRCGWVWARWVAIYPIVVALGWTFGDWASVLWDRGGSVNVALPNAIAITLLLVAVLMLSWRNVLIGVFAAVLPVLMWLAYFGAPWPTLPAVTLVFGLSTVVTAILRRMNPALVIVGVVLAGSALYGAAQQRWALVAALGLVVVAMAVVAVAAVPVAARVAGWLVGAAATVWLAYESGELAGFRPEATAYLVLLVAGTLLGLSLMRFAVAVAAEAAAHGAAVVALVLGLESTTATAGVLALWGVAVGLSALRRQPVERAVSAGVLEAVAWVVLLRSYDVGTLEAYTLPIAVVAVILGVVFTRGLSSWAAYGPALGAALLPSLGAVLLTTGGEWRRLLLGIGALAVTIAGAVWRKQAPFLLGGGTLIVLGLHEIVLAWKLVPTWIPLAIFGLLLVGLAITYERRRRDLARLRETVTRMS
ncbi:SCO7613 C-terminal domain-containing membrane protein [Allorhizocola rhizosphaerae]|uniref:SCO7613 C-terminal domain-containing membrane protein n=1 Tax=Allorhizocola rhizosphaerae TaxID=1872709 RepID=UPI0013C2F574|nr:hypothetical protein [Allorhizocola rhizosphaerae]